MGLSRRCIWVALVALLDQAAGQNETGSGATSTTSNKWRVLNAECLCDHWYIGEIEMFGEDGTSLKSQFQSVQVSHPDDQSLTVLHDGSWDSFSHDGGLWEGSVQEEHRRACGTWVSFTFNVPVAVHGLHMAQGLWSCQRSDVVSLEAWVNEAWQHVAYFRFKRSDVDFVGYDTRGDTSGDTPVGNDQCLQCCFTQSNPYECKLDYECPAFTICEDGSTYFWGSTALVVGAVILLLCCIAIVLFRRKRKRQQQALNSAGPAQRGAIATPQPMQQPAAVAVAAAMPIQQPAMTSVMVTCPPGVKPGDALQVAGPSGQMMAVQVPPGVMAGGQFMVQMPAAAAPVVMAQQAVPMASGQVPMGMAIP